MNYRMTIQYDGSRYKGWQRLGAGELTLQSKVEDVISGLLGTPTEITGCSRTDAGVHARGQVANFHCSCNLEPEHFRYSMNQELPDDIRIIAFEAVDDCFHSRYDARAKTYQYQIWNRDYSNPFLRKYSTHIVEPLELSKMKEAAAHFVGIHDFTAFSNAKTMKKTKVRELYRIEILEKEGLVSICLTGEGFLYNMARWIVGTLIDIGLGKLDPSSVPLMLESKDRGTTGNLAEACGLFLEKISYE